VDRAIVDVAAKYKVSKGTVEKSWYSNKENS
jgi:hypothetical protein